MSIIIKMKSLPAPQKKLLKNGNNTKG